MSGRIRWSRAGALFTVAALAASGCARQPAGSGSGGQGVRYPRTPSALVLRMDTSGGFVAPQTTLQQMPAFSLYGDGRVITQGAQIEIYPGPAMPSVIVTQLTLEGVSALLRDALAAGLGANNSYTSMNVSDMPTTTFTLVTGGITHTTSVYGLGAGAPAQAMSAAEREARAVLERFSAELSNVRGSLPHGSVGADRPYTPEGLRVFVQPPPEPQDPMLHQKTLAWPLATELSALGKPVSQLPDTRCGVVTGPDLAKLLPLVRSANELTPWKSDGTYSLRFQVLLPEQTTC
jgi:hypothetical protein